MTAAAGPPGGGKFGVSTVRVTGAHSRKYCGTSAPVRGSKSGAGAVMAKGFHGGLASARIPVPRVSQCAPSHGEGIVMKAHWPAPAGLHTASLRLPIEGDLPFFRRRDRVAQFGAADGGRLARESSPGRLLDLPASIGYAHFLMSAPGPVNTRTRGWWWSESIHPSSRSRKTPITSVVP